MLLPFFDALHPQRNRVCFSAMYMSTATESSLSHLHSCLQTLFSHPAICTSTLDAVRIYTTLSGPRVLVKIALLGWLAGRTWHHHPSRFASTTRRLALAPRRSVGSQIRSQSLLDQIGRIASRASAAAVFVVVVGTVSNTTPLILYNRTDCFAIELCQRDRVLLILFWCLSRRVCN